MRFKVILILLLLILATQCHRDASIPDPELNGKFKQAYMELIQLTALQNSNAYADSTIAVLDRIQLTQNDYNRMITYLNEKPERWHEFLQDVLEEIKTDKQSSSLESKPLISDGRL